MTKNTDKELTSSEIWVLKRMSHPGRQADITSLHQRKTSCVLKKIWFETLYQTEMKKIKK